MDRKNLVLLLSIVFIFGGCSHKAQEPPRYIKSMVVGSGSAQERRVFSGVSKFDIESNLSFQVAGQIKEVKVKLGDIVNKDDVVAILDDQDYQTNLQSAKSEYEHAQRDLERYRTLYENENVSRQQFEEVKTNAQVLESKFKLAETQLSYTVLKSPLEGKITKVYVNVHEVISSGQPIVKVEAESDLEVEVGVPEAFIEKVKPKNKVKVYFETKKDKPFPALVEEISYAIDEKTATFPVVVKVITDGYEGLRSGMVVDVEFFFPKTEGAEVIRIPLVATLEDQKKRKFVWVYNTDDAKVYKRVIKTGSTTGEYVEVTEGLKDGEIIAVAGAHYLKEGQPVKLLEE